MASRCVGVQFFGCGDTNTNAHTHTQHVCTYLLSHTPWHISWTEEKKVLSYYRASQGREALSFPLLFLLLAWGVCMTSSGVGGWNATTDMSLPPSIVPLRRLRGKKLVWCHSWSTLVQSTLLGESQHLIIILPHLFVCVCVFDFVLSQVWARLTWLSRMISPRASRS